MLERLWTEDKKLADLTLFFFQTYVVSPWWLASVKQLSKISISMLLRESALNLHMEVVEEMLTVLKLWKHASNDVVEVIICGCHCIFSVVDPKFLL